MSGKELFIEIYQTHIRRQGAQRLLDYLQSPASDFFEAPASTRFHGAYKGGLVDHSLNVYDCLKDYLSRERVKTVYGLQQVSEETIAVVALLHDLCKINVYHPGKRNVKINGEFEGDHTILSSETITPQYADTL